MDKLNSPSLLCTYCVVNRYILWFLVLYWILKLEDTRRIEVKFQISVFTCIISYIRLYKSLDHNSYKTQKWNDEV